MTGNLGFIASTVEGETCTPFSLLMENAAFREELKRLMREHDGKHMNILDASISIGNELAAFANDNLI